MKNEKIIAVVVTHNRSNELRKVVSAIKSQTKNVKKNDML